MLVIVSVGVMFVTGGLVRLLVGPNDRVFADGERFLVRARAFKAATGLDEGLSIPTTQALTLVVTFSEIALTYAWKKFLGYSLPASLAPDGLAQLLSTDYVLLATLRFAPRGLLPERVRRRVARSPRSASANRSPGARPSGAGARLSSSS